MCSFFPGFIPFSRFLLKITKSQDFSQGYSLFSKLFQVDWGNPLKSWVVSGQCEHIIDVAFTQPMSVIHRNHTGSPLQRVWLLRAPTYNEQIFFQQEILAGCISMFEKFSHTEYSLVSSTFLPPAKSATVMLWQDVMYRPRGGGCLPHLSRVGWDTLSRGTLSEADTPSGTVTCGRYTSYGRSAFWSRITLFVVSGTQCSLLQPVLVASVLASSGTQCDANGFVVTVTQHSDCSGMIHRSKGWAVLLLSHNIIRLCSEARSSAWA